MMHTEQNVAPYQYVLICILVCNKVVDLYRGTWVCKYSYFHVHCALPFFPWRTMISVYLVIHQLVLVNNIKLLHKLQIFGGVKGHVGFFPTIFHFFLYISRVSLSHSSIIIVLQVLKRAQRDAGNVVRAAMMRMKEMIESDLTAACKNLSSAIMVKEVGYCSVRQEYLKKSFRKVRLQIKYVKYSLKFSRGGY